MSDRRITVMSPASAKQDPNIFLYDSVKKALGRGVEQLLILSRDHLSEIERIAGHVKVNVQYFTDPKALLKAYGESSSSNTLCLTGSLASAARVYRGLPEDSKTELSTVF